MTPAPVRVVIADDQGMVRAGFSSLLGAEPDLTIVGEAADGRQAVEAVTRLRPDVVLMDIRMPVLDGLAATRELVAAQVETRVLVLTTFASTSTSSTRSGPGRRVSCSRTRPLLSSRRASGRWRRGTHCWPPG